MKRLLTYTTALTLLTAPAFADMDMDADAKMDLIRSAQQTLNEFSIPVDADALTVEQLAEIEAVDVSDRSQAEMRLEQIVNVSDNAGAATGTATVEGATYAANVPESDVVQDILDDFDIQADADALSNEQKAEIMAVDVSDRSQAEMKLMQIVSG